MAGNLSVPSTFATQVGNVPASQIDDDFAAVVNYVNPREVGSGTFAGRPAGSTGQWYFANDVGGGILYFKTNGGWIQAAGSVGSSITVPVTVSNGGTGSTTWQAAGFLMVNGASPFLVEGTPLNIAFGGTGSASWQANGVLLGNGTAALKLVSMARSGTLLVGQLNAAPIPVAIGADATVLTADSTQPAGLKWSAAGASGISVFDRAFSISFNTSSAENTIYTKSVSGNTLGATGKFRVTLSGTVTDTNAALTARTVTWRFKFGATTLITIVQQTAGSDGATFVTNLGATNLKMVFELQNLNATNSQAGTVLSTGQTAQAPATGEATFVLSAGSTNAGAATNPTFWHRVDRGTSAIDSTAAQTLAITAQMNTSNAANALSIDAVIVEQM